MLWFGERIRSTMLRLLAITLAVFAASGIAFAAASGTIKGQVLDDSELAIPGVLVTLASDKLIGGAVQYTTDGEGNFLFVELPPGAYKIEAQKQGFSKVTKTGVQVSVGRTTQVTVQMKYGGETVVIQEKRKVVDTESVAQSTTFSKDYLSRIPTGNDYLGALENAAGVIGGGNASMGGASGNENTWTLDGVNVSDPVTGTFSTNFNYDAIEEVQIVTGGFDPEYGESLGGLVSLVTSSGGNTLSVKTGVTYGNGNWAPKLDARFAADGIELNPTGFDSSSQQGSVRTTVSGPIVRDRVWFLGSYQYSRSLYSNVGIRNPRDFEGHYFFGKITAQPVSAHRFSLTLSVTPTTIDNIEQGDRFTLPEAQGRQAQGGYITTAKWNWFLSEDANLETTAALSKTYLEISGVPCTHDRQLDYNPCEASEAENTIDYSSPGRQGLYGAYSRRNFNQFQFDDRWRGSLASKFSVLQVDFLGKHDFKAGVEANYSYWNWITGYTGNMTFVDLYQNSFNPDTLTNYYQLEFSGYSRFTASQVHVGTFIQDVYKPIDNLTFRYGIRYDRSQARNDVGEPIIDLGVFGPRFYAAWDPWGDEKTKLTAGYGRFNDSARLEIASYLSKSGYGQKLIVGEYFDKGNSSADAVYFDYNTSSQFTYGDLSSPHSDEISAGVEREVVTDFRVGLKFDGKFTRNVYSFDETNLIYDEDGYAFIGAGEGTSDVRLAYRLRTPSVARRDYFRVDLEFIKPTAKRWFTSLVYSYTSSRGTSQNALSGNLSNPSQVELNYGALDSDVNHQVKASVFWDVPDDPWTTTIGMSGYVYSGFPVSRYYWQAADLSSGQGQYGLLKQPVGEYARTQWYWEMNLKLKQAVPVDKGKLSATLELYNFTNNQYDLYLSEYYVAADNRYVSYYRQSPVSVVLGAEYEF